MRLSALSFRSLASCNIICLDTHAFFLHFSSDLLQSLMLAQFPMSPTSYDSFVMGSGLQSKFGWTNVGENLTVEMSWLRKRLTLRQKLASNLPSSSARWINVVRKETDLQMLQWPRRKPQALGTLETSPSPRLKTLRISPNRRSHILCALNHRAFNPRALSLCAHHHCVPTSHAPRRLRTWTRCPEEKWKSNTAGHRYGVGN